MKNKINKIKEMINTHQQSMINQWEWCIKHSEENFHQELKQEIKSFKEYKKIRMDWNVQDKVICMVVRWNTLIQVLNILEGKND